VTEKVKASRVDAIDEKQQIDHVIPISKGGRNSRGNLVIACVSCNLEKSDKFPYQFSGRLL